MFRVRSPQDLGAGVVFIVIGIAGILFGQDLAFGSAARMGPGYFPMLLSWLIIAIGLMRRVQVAGRPRGRRSSPFSCARSPSSWRRSWRSDC